MSAIAIDVKNVTIRFNMASEKIDNLKEYFVKLLKRELLFQEFLAVKTPRLPSAKERRGRLSGVTVPANLRC